jgi:hypothetical protein
MVRLLAFLAIAGSVFCLAPHDAGAQPEATAQPDIVITGVRPEQIQAFVEQVSAVPPAADQIARWDDNICMSVAGLSEEQGQHVVDRISYRAEAIGLDAGREGCRPNVFIFFANDADDFARRLFDERKSLFAYYHEEHIVTLGQLALADFVETPRPVRWWHVTQTRGADGDRLGSSQASNNSPPPPEMDALQPPDADSLQGAQAVRSYGTRVRAVQRQDFNRVIIIVDGERAAGYPVDAIADYVAMVTLAQIDPQAQTRDYPTILNLFADDPENASFEMTNWDVAYLDGLYRSTRNAASATQQVRDISRRMTGRRTPGG